MLNTMRGLIVWSWDRTQQQPGAKAVVVLLRRVRGHCQGSCVGASVHTVAVAMAGES